jgi:hypothetical protein
MTRRRISNLRPAAVILIRISFSLSSESSGIGKVIWVRGLPISVRARAVWVDIVKLKQTLRTLFAE